MPEIRPSKGDLIQVRLLNARGFNQEQLITATIDGPSS